MQFVILILMIISLPTFASENDHFTDRDFYEDGLPDFLDKLNQITNKYIDQGVERYNKRFCGIDKNMSDLEIHRMLALEIHNMIAREDRNNFPEKEEKIFSELTIFHAIAKSGKGPMQKYIEDTKKNVEYLMNVSNNIYSEMYPFGINSKAFIVKVNNIIVGSDKMDHFLDQGYDYWRISEYGKNDSKAIKYGVDSELGWYGFLAGGVFSFGDLRANWKGYQFYKSLFQNDEGDGYFKVRFNNCVEKKIDFSWASWVDWQFDEFLNPSAYDNKSFKKIRKHILKNKKSYCRTYKYYMEKDYYKFFPSQKTYEYLNGEIPENLDNIFDLEGICPNS